MKRLIITTTFAAFLLIGLLSYTDFGISWDEKTQYVIGKETFETVFHGLPVATDTGRRFHGPIIEFTLYALQQLFTFESAQDVFFFRHLLSFLFFYVGVVFFYLLSKKIFDDWKLGLLGAAMLFFSPRIFAHSFFNTRDIPTLVLFIISMFTLLMLLEKRSIKYTIIHGIVCALLLSTRMTGLLMTGLTGLGLGCIKIDRHQMMRIGGTFAVIFVLCTISFWPLLWEDPLTNFIAAYQNMSNKPAGGFYLGNNIDTNPWHWVPVWMLVTTPLIYSAFFLVGLWRSSKKVDRTRTLILLWFFTPVLMIMLGLGNIFDTWRHLFFIYPAFLLIAVDGLQWSYEKTKLSAIVLFVSIGLTAVWMFANHPMQYMYFSIPSSYAEKNFELDYWGLGYRKAIEAIIEWEDLDLIPIHVTDSAGITTLNILSPEQRARIHFDSIERSKYVIDNLRDSGFPEELRVDSVRVDGINAVRVFVNPHWSPAVLDEIPSPQYTKELIFAFGKEFMDPERADRAVITPSEMWVFFEP